MKKIISSLFVAFLLLMNVSAVGFAESPGEGEPSETTAEKTACDQDDYKFWDTGLNICVDWQSFCEEKGMEYDAGIKGCYNPNTQQGTVLPGTRLTVTECEYLFTFHEGTDPGYLKDIMLDNGESVPELEFYDEDGNMHYKDVYPLDILGCGIKSGRITLWMIPFFIKYLIQFALGIAGLIAIGSIIIGGYFYLFSSFIDDKDKGKRAIIYGVVGFIVAILAWTIVNVVIAIISG